jgi:hypothetical protein
MTEMLNTRTGAVVMSNYLHTLMVEAVHDGGISLDRMLQLKAGTAGSAIRREYFSWSKQEEQFVLTPKALAVMELYDGSEITRKQTFRPLSSFIHDASAIKLAESRREELKAQYRKEQGKDRGSERDRVRRKTVAMKSNGHRTNRSQVA